MKAKLIKSDIQYTLHNEEGIVIQYRLHNEEGIVIATSIDGKLSIKNCEAIANGYDLDELSTSRLATRFDENGGYHKFVFVEAYKEGFLKALEILGDKKFSKEDMGRIMVYGYDKSTENEYLSRIPFDEYIQSLQQTEWDVEIDVLMTEREGGVVIETPKLDADSCLILKRI